jgi:hypothetical protein
VTLTPRGTLVPNVGGSTTVSLSAVVRFVPVWSLPRRPSAAAISRVSELSGPGCPDGADRQQPDDTGHGPRLPTERVSPGDRLRSGRSAFGGCSLSVFEAMTVFQVTAVVSTTVTILVAPFFIAVAALLYAFAVRRLLGLRLGGLRTLIAGSLPFLSLPRSSPPSSATTAPRTRAFSPPCGSSYSARRSPSSPA